MSGPTLQSLLDGYAMAPALGVTGVETDSRRVTAGDVFLAVQGVAGHGLAHLETALANGAAAVVWEPAAGIAEPEDLPVPQVAVPQLARKVGAIAARFHGDPARKLFTVGVTGTDGKTSTAWLVAQALDALGMPCGYVGTIGTGRVDALREASHTTPDPIRLQELFAGFVEQRLAAVAMEVSSHALDQARVGGIAFDAVVLTNVTRDHLDYHRTVEAYAAAKQKLFTEYAKGQRVLNRDDATGAAWAVELARGAEARQVTVYGIEGDAPAAGRYLLAREVQLTPSGIAFAVESSWGRAAVRSRLLGRFNVYNLLAVLAVLLGKGVPLAEAAEVLATLHTVPGRIEGFRGTQAGQPLVVVDYAHTPEALAQILGAVRAHCAGKLHLVFGCGGDRDRGKRPLMGEVAERLADAVIVTDDNPRSEAPETIVAEILGGMRTPDRATVLHDRAAAIRQAIAAADGDRGDVVVVAGKGHETTQTIGASARPFSDRTQVAAALADVVPAPGSSA